MSGLEDRTITAHWVEHEGRSVVSLGVNDDAVDELTVGEAMSLLSQLASLAEDMMAELLDAQQLAGGD